MNTQANCPSCHSGAQVVRIVYGKPAASLIEDAKQGKVHLGGCMMSGENHYCKACSKAFK